MDDVEPVDHAQGRMEIGLDRQVGHDHQRHGAVFGSVVAGVVLDHAGDADAFLTQDLANLARTPGPVGDREMEVIAALDLAGRREGNRGRPIGPEVQAAARERRPGR